MASAPDPGQADHAADRKIRNRRVGFIMLLLALGMLGLGYAAVPLYRVFCQVTGYGGTPKRVDEVQAAGVKASGHQMSVRFDANIDRDMPWTFKPEQVTQTVVLGARSMALFDAENNSDQTITGTASFNVMPEDAAAYFNKIQCFCFTEQTLKPHEKVRMPVIYYVDPKILDDKDAKDTQQITLSYTFHVAADSPSRAGGPQPAK